MRLLPVELSTLPASLLRMKLIPREQFRHAFRPRWPSPLRPAPRETNLVAPQLIDRGQQPAEREERRDHHDHEHGRLLGHVVELGLAGGSYPALAEAMTDAGFPVTVDAIKKARSRGGLPEHAMDALTLDEERFLAWAFTKWPEFEAERLVIFGTPAAVAVVELRAAA